MNVQKSSIGLGTLTAIASSLCCITPLLAIFAGTSGIASTFQWVEPLRPWLIGFTILVLGFAWYQMLKPIPKDDCDCEVPKTSFFQSKSFLSIVTVFALLMLSFPTYAHVFYPNQEKEGLSLMDESNISLIEVKVNGMTCAGCEGHVEHAVNELEGVYEVKASYEQANTVVKFDSSQTSLEEVITAIKSTNYKVGDSKNIK